MIYDDNDKKEMATQTNGGQVTEEEEDYNIIKWCYIQSWNIHTLLKFPLIHEL